MQAAPALHLVCSEAERHKLAALLPSTARICVIENTIDVNAAGTRRRVDAGHDSGPLLFFPGVLNYPPNRDAVTRLVSAILPGVQQTLPGARLSILGRGSAAIEESVTRSPSVRFAGEVEDVSPYFAAATLMCVPLRAGGGTRFKILEAFAWRLPVVSTPKGCENLNVTDGEHLMIADTDAEIINAVIAIHDSEELRKRLAHNGHELVCSQYSHEVVHKKFFELIQYITKGI
jgi:glycosyltransferase involved in cell wall biosynthesis